jgi:hypothetical protein
MRYSSIACICHGPGQTAKGPWRIVCVFSAHPASLQSELVLVCLVRRTRTVRKWRFRETTHTHFTKRHHRSAPTVASSLAARYFYSANSTWPAFIALI